MNEKVGFDVGKIKDGMSVMDMVLAMSEGNLGAMMVIKGMVEDPVGSLDILLLDKMGIYGSRIYMLHNDCCNCNPGKFKRTLMMLRCGVFSKEEVDANLKLIYAIPFIDDGIEMDGVPSYDEDFYPDDPKWGEWCEAQKESFKKRLKQRLDKEKEFDTQK